MAPRIQVSLLILSSLTIGACSQQSGGVAETNDATVEMVMTPPGAPATATEAAAAADSSAPPPAASITQPQLAYIHRYGLEIPADRAVPLMQRHEQACVSAGASVCTVMSSVSSRYGRDEVSATLELRATPIWLARFRAGLESQAEQAGGRVASATTESEDLSRQLTDTEARLRALTTLRDRLEQLLATRSAPLEQLLQTERELARVQGELDATRSALEVMRGRVATSRLTLEYRSEGQLAPDSAFRPVKSALDNALGVSMAVIGALILVLAGLAPILLIAGPLAWWWLKRRRAKALEMARGKAAGAQLSDQAE